MSTRTVRTIFPTQREDIADLITRRPVHPLEQLNPFLFINHHGPQTYPPGNRGLPFGPHPHRGFETVTFIAEGSLVHSDTAGHTSAISAGGIQWMTAGRGIEHSETSSREFRERGGPLEILQLWINLPASLKMTEPRYIGLQSEEIPAVRTPDGKAAMHLIAGEQQGVHGPVESLTNLTLMTIALEAGAELPVSAPAARRVFLYVVRGHVHVGGTNARSFDLVELHQDGDFVRLNAVTQALVIFGHADPLEEPIAAQGPFVMNTREEILATIREYQTGGFRDAPSSR